MGRASTTRMCVSMWSQDHDVVFPCCTGRELRNCEGAGSLSLAVPSSGWLGAASDSALEALFLPCRSESYRSGVKAMGFFGCGCGLRAPVVCWGQRSTASLAILSQDTSVSVQASGRVVVLGPALVRSAYRVWPI